MSSMEPLSQAADSTRTPLAGQAPREAIVAANDRLMEALRAHDAAGMAACYTPDAQLLPANSDVVAGTEAIAAFWGGVIQMGIADVRLDTLEVEAQGDLAVEVGRYVLNVADGAAADDGKYVVVWHRHGGAWKLHRDIWTTSRPAPS